MNEEDKLKQEFLTDFKELIDKYNVEIEAEDYYPISACIGSGNKWVSIDLGQIINDITVSSLLGNTKIKG